MNILARVVNWKKSRHADSLYAQYHPRLDALKRVSAELADAAPVRMEGRILRLMPERRKKVA